DKGIGPHFRVEIRDRYSYKFLAFSADNKMLAAGYAFKADKEEDNYTGISLIDLESNHIIAGPAPPQVDGKRNSFTCAAYTPDGRSFVCGHENGTLALWKTATMRLRQT